MAANWWCSKCEKFVEIKDGIFVEHTVNKGGSKCANSKRRAV